MICRFTPSQDKKQTNFTDLLWIENGLASRFHYLLSEEVKCIQINRTWFESLTSNNSKKHILRLTLIQSNWHIFQMISSGLVCWIENYRVCCTADVKFSKAFFLKCVFYDIKGPQKCWYNAVQVRVYQFGF